MLWNPTIYSRSSPTSLPIKNHTLLAFSTLAPWHPFFKSHVPLLYCTSAVSSTWYVLPYCSLACKMGGVSLLVKSVHFETFSHDWYQAIWMTLIWSWRFWRLCSVIWVTLVDHICLYNLPASFLADISYWQSELQVLDFFLIIKHHFTSRTL